MPLNEDKQRKACPRRAIYIHCDPTIPNIHIRRNTLSWGYTLIIYKREISRRDIKITHANASVASPLCLDSKLRSLIEQTVTFRKRPFETGPTNGSVSRSIDVIYIRPPTPERTFTGAKIRIIFEITNNFQKKSHFRAKKVISEED